VRVSEEPNVELLRQKAEVLERDNERLGRRVSELLREMLALKGMTPEQVALNLPGLLAQASGSAASKLTKPGGEQRPRTKPEEVTKPPQVGHGPTPQPELPIIEETFDLDEADKSCPKCGGQLEWWQGQEDETEVVDVIERQWVVRKRKFKKYHCACVSARQTAERKFPFDGVGMASSPELLTAEFSGVSAAKWRA
jgi:transposase